MPTCLHAATSGLQHICMPRLLRRAMRMVRLQRSRLKHRSILCNTWSLVIVKYGWPSFGGLLAPRIQNNSAGRNNNSGTRFRRLARNTIEHEIELSLALAT